MYFILWSILALVLGAHAQMGDFLPTQQTISRPFSLPIKVDVSGNIDFVTGGRDLVFAPGIQLGFDKNFVQYSIPTLATEFYLEPATDESGWMELKRWRYDYGAGLVSVIKTAFRLGLAPYKGASFSERKLKVHRFAPTSPKIYMPLKLSEMESWSTGDAGNYQTYGGIQAYGALDLGPINLATARFAWQNQFIVSVERQRDGILLAITEEGLERKSLYAGIDPANITLSKYRGKRLRAEFELDFNDPAHHDLYELAIKGEIHRLEEILSPERKKVTWEGHDYSVYWGVPFLIAETRSQGSFHVQENNQDYYLEVILSKRSGLLVPTALQQKFVYHNSESVLLLWTTDMKKSSPKKLRQHFFGPAKAVGFGGFDIELDNDVNYGTVIGEVGVVLTKLDISKFALINEALVARDFNSRCVELKLSCSRPSKFKKIMNSYVLSMKKGWEDQKKDLGILLVKEPALLHALLKNTRIAKEAYFKFLSDRYQSLEGLTVLVL